MEYYNISAFTTQKQAIIDEVMKMSIEEVPMVWFLPIEGNTELLRWIDEAIR